MLLSPSRTVLMTAVLMLCACSDPVAESHVQCVPADKVYEQRIAPLVSGNRPSSCNQCHLSGIDLRMFVRETPCRSMACLLAQGEVNLKAPTESPILKRILLASPQSPLIGEDVITEEYDGFLAWIEHSAGCHTTQCESFADPCGNDAVGPLAAPAPLGSCTEDALVDAFETYVYRWKGRCAGCHSGQPKSGKNGGPWLDTGGDRAAVMRTMYNVIGLNLIDVEKPVHSLLLTKPLHTDDVSGTAVEHGGGNKLSDKEDPSYRDFRTWIEFYAACYQGKSSEIGGQAVPVGACNNPDDRKTLEDYHNILYGCLSSTCVGKRVFEACLLSCLQVSYSDACAECGAEFVACKKANCADECVDPESRDCTRCTGHRCEPKWIQCAGMLMPSGDFDDKKWQ